MDLREFQYLDTRRLEDYMSSLGVADLSALREVEHRQTEIPGGSADEFAVEETARIQDDVTRERTHRVSDRRHFGQVYDRLDGELVVDPESTAEVGRKAVLEITRDFEPSPLNQMLDSLAEIMRLLQAIEHPDLSSPEVQAVVAFLSLLQGSGTSAEIPMMSLDREGMSVLFIARPEYILSPPGEFLGEMTLMGRVREVVSPGHSVDLIELLKLLPRTLRRAEGGGQLRKGLANIFADWPKEFGPALSEDALQLNGPALVVDPLAVYI